jgi:hypothetical protein
VVYSRSTHSRLIEPSTSRVYLSAFCDTSLCWERWYSLGDVRQGDPTMTSWRVRTLVRTLLTFNPSAPIQSRAVVASGLLMAVCLTSSFCWQANAQTDWEIMQLAYDFPHEILHSGMAISESDRMDVPSTYTDVYVRSGPGPKAKRMLDGAKLPKWSPDRGKLAFLTYCRPLGGSMCVEIAKADGSHRVRLTTDHEKDWVSAFNFSWSPSGGEIAYIQGDQKQKWMTLGIVRPDGSGRKEIQNLQCPSLIATVDWSPDGQKIALTGCSSKGPTIVIVDRTGEGSHVVVDGSGPLWSPDGKMLLFRKQGLCVVNADGTEERKVLEGEDALFGLTWLPSGHGIAFASPRLGASETLRIMTSPGENKTVSEIFRINVDGTGLQKVASGVGEGLSFATPIFSPDFLSR